MSEEHPEGTRKENVPKITRAGHDLTRPYPFEPTHSFEDAVTKLVADYNGSAREHQLPEILPGQVVVVRVFYEDISQKPEGGYSKLDRLKFDGVATTTLFPNQYETSIVGAFAGRATNENGVFTDSSNVMLQIAKYGEASELAVRARDTSHLELSGPAVESLSLGDEGLEGRM